MSNKFVYNVIVGLKDDGTGCMVMNNQSFNVLASDAEDAIRISKKLVDKREKNNIFIRSVELIVSVDR